MQMQKVNWKWWITFAVLGLAALVLFAEHRYQCDGEPLSRDEAVQRARVQLNFLNHDFNLGDPLPELKDEQYDRYTKSWTITFQNATCKVSVITDRCHGTDIGGVSEGCKERRATR